GDGAVRAERVEENFREDGPDHRRLRAARRADHDVREDRLGPGLRAGEPRLHQRAGARVQRQVPGQGRCRRSAEERRGSWAEGGSSEGRRSDQVAWAEVSKSSRLTSVGKSTETPLWSSTASPVSKKPVPAS